jgi:hypothetical protein
MITESSAENSDEDYEDNYELVFMESEESHLPVIKA